MRLSISVTEYSWPGGPAALSDQLDAVVRAADDGGLDTVWIADHLMQLAPGTAPEDEMLEAYATLGYLAARTTRVRLGTMVTAVDVPTACAAGQGRHHHRRTVRRSRLARHRRRVPAGGGRRDGAAPAADR